MTNQEYSDRFRRVIVSSNVQILEAMKMLASPGNYDDLSYRCYTEFGPTVFKAASIFFLHVQCIQNFGPMSIWKMVTGPEGLESEDGSVMVFGRGFVSQIFFHHHNIYMVMGESLMLNNFRN